MPDRRIEGTILKILWEIRRIPILEVKTDDERIIGIRPKRWEDLPKDLLGAKVVAYGREIGPSLFLADLVGIRESGEQTLLSRQPIVIVDSNEAAMTPLMIARLRDFGFNVAIESLSRSGADYILSSRVGVQRKALDDLCASIKDGRIFDELADLSSSFQIPILLLEGMEARSQMRPESLMGVLAYLALEIPDIRIIHAKDLTASALFMRAIVRREQEPPRGRLPVLKEWLRAKDLSEMQLRVVQSLPYVGGKTGLRLLRQLQKPEAVMTADEAIFAEHVGRKRARLIKRVLTEPFEAGTERAL
ncbi:MAG: ERCC4 domain-containing protein [Candidatus Bathyarchaeia archaeon]